MSHAVTIRTTTTTTGNSSTLMVNSGYIKTVPGLLKLLQLILGAVCLGIVAYYYTRYGHITNGNPDLFFFLVTTSFLIGTFCLLVSCLFSLGTGGIISKTIYELIYHSLATVLYLAASLALLIKVSELPSRFVLYDPYMAASIIGLVNTVLYCVSSIYAQRSYRGI